MKKSLERKTELLITLGLPCSGKTTFINDYYPGYRKISADDLKESHRKYDPNNVTNEVHQWSVKQAREALFVAINENVDIAFDSGSINNHYTIGILKDVTTNYPEYYIKLIWIKTPYQVCLERNKKRFRKVPEYAITDKAIKEIGQYHALEPYADFIGVMEYFTNKHIFCDMDGVIAAQTTLPIINGEIDFVNGQIHRWQKVVTQVVDVLMRLESEGAELHILSATPNSFSSQEKKDWLDEHIPYFRGRHSNVYFVNQGKHKAEMLENLVRKLRLDKKDVLMVDDTHSILYDVKERGMNAMHVSEFLTL